MALIEAHHISKVFGDGDNETHALRDVTLEVDRGEFVAIMGPSGSGKSTLLHILGMLDVLSGGKYIFDGRSVAEYSEVEVAHLRNKKLGFIFQAFNLLPRASVLDNVVLPLLYSDVPKSEWEERALAKINAVGLGHRTYHTPAQLSGGEKQRAAIARALITDPDVVFADEPTGNLDSKSGKAVMEIIQRLNEEQGKTVILITHETYTAEHAHRIVRLYDGVVESDTVITQRHRAASDFQK